MKLSVLVSTILCGGLLTVPLHAIEREDIRVSAVDAPRYISLGESEHTQALRDSIASQYFGLLAQGQELSGISGATPSVAVLQLPVGTQRFTQGALEVEGAENVSFYLNGERLTSQNGTVDLALPTGDHLLTVLAEGIEQWSSVDMDWQGKADHDVIDTSYQTEVRLGQTHSFDAPTATVFAASADGKYLVWRKQSFGHETGNNAQNELEIVDTTTNRTVYRWNQASAHSFAWHPDQNTLAFIDGGVVHLLDIQSMNLRSLTSSLESIGGLHWLGNDQLLFSWRKAGEQDGDMVKRYRALEDRWSYFRDNSQIYLLNTQTKLISQVSDSSVSTSLESVHGSGDRILVSRSVVDYREPAHYLVELYELALATGEETQIGQYRTFNQAMYMGDDIYVVAGPEFGNGAGRNLPEGMLANNYDGQLYRLNGSSVEPLSLEFDPAIGSIEKLSDNHLLLDVTDKDTSQLYVFDTEQRQFEKLATNMDVVSTYALSANNKERIYFAGTDATQPSRMGVVGVNGSNPEILWDSADTHYAQVNIHDIREWNFENERGDTIHGRIYLPPEFDPSAQYPALVYYYGGTSPVQRAFTGRYPFNQWAAQGYVVYVLQPSGATGFGQEFSARHVNAWGEYTANEIIYGTERFLEAHSFVDPERVGHLGASYGGFMTMLLATMTDIYSASMSHAGISNITSYWGQGWWGFLYSGEASKGSFPWNNEELYTQRSPIYHADQVTAPMLLIHGDADTNVPPGESHNMYTALKLLDKEVELVEFLGADHHIIYRDERFRWWDTYMAFFDKHLKDEPQWWDYLYPEAE
ncbi:MULTISPECIES: S9 family peptidase [Gammaproteobacteria]|uniref:alpha/beta hydrolase family protein n=1 Tax=Gammaproteobacteria TaxID=1236 RepID=UPI001401E1E4|nr:MULTISPECIES: prolyl oligopeptidase family serine peptidase [Gammaproteobacteria]